MTLHNVVGVYPLVFFLIFTLTTLVFAFPDASRRVLYALTLTPPDPVFQLDPEPGAERLPIDRLVAAADAAEKVIAIHSGAWKDGGKSAQQWRASLSEYAYRHVGDGRRTVRRWPGAGRRAGRRTTRRPGSERRGFA